MYEQAKHFLNSYHESTFRMNAMEHTISDLRDRATRISAALNPDKVQSGSQWDRVGDAAVMIVDVENRMRSEIMREKAILDQVTDVIMRVPDGVLQSLLLARYVRCLTWEQIAEELCYEPRNTYRLHGKALQEVDKILGGNKK